MEVFGLPLHPLIVHAAVVFVPLTMIGAVVISFWRKGRARYGSLTLILSLVTAAVAVAAKLSGEALRASLPAVPPVVNSHETYGSALVWPSLVVVIGIALLLVADGMTGRSASAPDPREVTKRAAWFRIVGLAINVVSAATGLTLVILAGHTGATAVWG
jgi:uncharacterized membrane protein